MTMPKRNYDKSKIPTNFNSGKVKYDKTNPFLVHDLPDPSTPQLRAGLAQAQGDFKKDVKI